MLTLKFTVLHAPTEPERRFADGMGRLRNALLHLLAEGETDPSGLRGIGIGCTGPLDPFRWGF